MAWILHDGDDQPGDLQWGFHAGVTFLVDRVSIGQYDASATQFAARGMDILADTFSLNEPAHNSQLKNGDEGNWSGNGGSRAFAEQDSLAVKIDDPTGVTATNVELVWRVGAGTPPVFGSWNTKDMVFSDPETGAASDEGTYRGTFGNTTTEDYSATEGSPDRMWDPGDTAEYYVKVTDDSTNVVVWPATADDTPNPAYFRVQILPQNRIATGSTNILLVDDSANALDFENSDAFQPTGGAGFGNFDLPTFDAAEDMVERALMAIYGGSEDYDGGVYGTPKWDIYNTGGANTSQQREARVISNVTDGLGGICDDLGNPNYDAVIWIHGTTQFWTYADTTRIELKTFLDTGGKLFSTGDDVLNGLSEGGEGQEDSVIHFDTEYLGAELLISQDDDTADRVLNVEGSGGTSLAGLKLGLYGECPVRRSFDKLTIVSPPILPGRVTTQLASYQAGDGATNNRTAIVKTTHPGGGVAIHCGFAIEALVSTNARACLLSKVFATDFGLPAPYAACANSGTDAPVVSAGRFGFDLAQATPNPFRDATSIRFSVPSRTHVSIEVYNILGQKVRQLVDETLDSNSYVREWDGRADSGASVSSGIYFYKMVAGDYSATRKAVVLK
jgi:hypothetical protein